MRVFKSMVKAASFLAVCLVCMTFVSATSGEPMDIVVLFDMNRSVSGESGEVIRSGEMLDSGASFDVLARFEETRDYITGAFLKEFLRKGDTFHLISFGETPRIELSRRIEGEGDYRTIIGRLLLLYPLAQRSSFENAAAYAERFIAELPSARQKKVVFFTAQGIGAELGARFNNENTDVYLASIPASFGTLASGRALLKAPPKITPPVIAARQPVPPPVPSAPLVLAPPVSPPVQAPPVLPPVLASPVSPPVLTPPVSGRVERTEPAPLPNIEPPVLNVLPLNPPDITVVPANPESRFIWNSDVEPIPFDKFKALTIILPMAGMILLFALVLGCAVTWKKKDRADTYAIKDYLSQMNGTVVPENVEDDTHYAIPTRGLLQKADEMKGQLA